MMMTVHSEERGSQGTVYKMGPWKGARLIQGDAASAATRLYLMLKKTLSVKYCKINYHHLNQFLPQLLSII